MLEFAVILSDKRDLGKNETGVILSNFLKIFNKSKEILTLNLNELDKTEINTKNLFICIPNSINKKHFKNIKYKKLFLYDYYDSDNPAWFNTDYTFLQSLTNRYFKTWKNISNNRINGLLPVFIKPFKLYSKFLKKKMTNRKYDIFFIGSPTHIVIDKKPYFQRIEWLLEIAGKYKFFGGIIDRKEYPKKRFEKIYGNIDNIYLEKNLNYWRYWSKLGNSKICLLPGGNTRWTYRHWEAAYAGCLMLSNNISNIQTLIPLPKNLHIVNDHEKISPTIDILLKKVQENFEKPKINNLNQYWDYGKYSKKKPLIYDRFMEMLK